MAPWKVPISVIVLTTMLGAGGVIGLRIVRRVLWEGAESRRRARGSMSSIANWPGSWTTRPGAA